MKVFSYLFILVATGSMLLSSCMGKNSGRVAFPTDSVMFKNVILVDSVCFSDAVNAVSKIKVKVNIDLLQHYKDTAAFADFKSHFIKFLFGVDTVCANSEEDVNVYVKSFFNNFRSADSLAIGGLDGKFLDVEELEGVPECLLDAEINVFNVYNKSGIVSVCKEKILHFENQEKSVEHYYMNYNLKRQEVIDLASLFNVENYEDLNVMLRRKLMADNNAESEDDLISCGYFNLDNLAVTDNFKITDNGVVWCYQPLEIGCFSVGETEILLEFNELKQYMTEESATALN